MKYKPHHELHHAIGISRIIACIYPCFFAPTNKGSFYSKRFKKEYKTALKNMI